MSGDEEEVNAIDMIVVGFEEDDCIVSPTSPLSSEELESLVGKDVEYEDFKGVIWRGKVVEIRGEDMLLVRFDKEALSEGGPSGLGQGSLVRVVLKK